MTGLTALLRPTGRCGKATRRRDARSLATVAVLAFFLSISLAGCLDSQSPAAAEPGDDLRRVVFFLESCVEVFFALRTPHDTVRPANPPPEEWRRSGLVEEHLYEVFDCSSVIWGGVELGPLRFVIESSDVGGVPEACTAALPGRIRYPHAIYTDSSVFGELFAAWMDIEYHAAGAAVDPGSPTAPGQVAWLPTGHAATVVTFSAVVRDSEGPWADQDYFVTSNETSTAVLRLDFARRAPSINHDGGLAQFQTPTAPAWDGSVTYPVSTGVGMLRYAAATIQVWPRPLCDV